VSFVVYALVRQFVKLSHHLRIAVACVRLAPRLIIKVAAITDGAIV
jgi:hypothetical protein